LPFFHRTNFHLPICIASYEYVSALATFIRLHLPLRSVGQTGGAAAAEAAASSFRYSGGRVAARAKTRACAGENNNNFAVFVLWNFQLLSIPIHNNILFLISREIRHICLSSIDLSSIPFLYKYFYALATFIRLHLPLPLRSVGRT